CRQTLCTIGPCFETSTTAFGRWPPRMKRVGGCGAGNARTIQSDTRNSTYFAVCQQGRWWTACGPSCRRRRPPRRHRLGELQADVGAGKDAEVAGQAFEVHGFDVRHRPCDGEPGRGYIRVNDRLQTSAPDVWATPRLAMTCRKLAGARSGSRAARMVTNAL